MPWDVTVDPKKGQTNGAALGLNKQSQTFILDALTLRLILILC